MTTGTPNPSPSQDDLQRYLHATSALESTRSQLEALEQSEAVGVYQKQLALLQRRLLAEPQSFRDMFMTDGTQAVVWEFQQEELGVEFTQTLAGPAIVGTGSALTVIA